MKIHKEILECVSEEMRIAIEGNIGCGKTTLIKNLSVKKGFEHFGIILEPIEVWQPWLHEMYNDPQRWSFFFNLKVLLTLSSWFPRTDAATPVNVICERSPLACRHVFCKVQHERHELSDKEMELLMEAHDALGWEPDVVIYLRAPPDVCEKHMMQRGRTSEANVSLQYLTQVHDKYEELFQTPSKYKLVVVETNEDTEKQLTERVAQIIKNLG